MGCCSWTYHGCDSTYAAREKSDTVVITGQGSVFSEAPHPRVNKRVNQLSHPRLEPDDEPASTPLVATRARARRKKRVVVRAEEKVMAARLGHRNARRLWTNERGVVSFGCVVRGSFRNLAILHEPMNAAFVSYIPHRARATPARARVAP